MALHNTELLQSFTSVLNVKGRPFGQLNKPTSGTSDGNKGVQWNISISSNTGIIEFGVNLEGLKYKNWPIATFILSELDSPNIGEIRSILKKPEDVYIRFSRDAWQFTSRPNIVEKYLGGKEVSFAEIDSDHWALILHEALKCLDSEKNYRGRADQTVARESKPKTGEQVEIMQVSPHLTIWSSMTLDGDITENMQNKLAELQPIYDWVARVSQS